MHIAIIYILPANYRVCLKHTKQDEDKEEDLKFKDEDKDKDWKS